MTVPDVAATCDGSGACQVDTCGENRDGTPWPATKVVHRDGHPIYVCDAHADGWDDK